MKAPVTTYAPRSAGVAKPVLPRAVVLIVGLLAVLFVARALLGHRENTYEKIAASVTVALQKNDVASVKKYQNAETATHVTASRVGRGADTLGPLGSLKRIHETSADPNTRIHQFDATFDKGTLHETIKFDPEQKIVSFRYDEPVLTK